MISVFKNPTSFEWHSGAELKINGVDISKDLKTAIDSYNKGDLDAFGFHLGQVLANTHASEETKLFLKEQNKKKVAEIIQGMLRPYGGKFNLENLLLCIYEED